MIGRLGSTELLVILGIVLVIFGPSKLPEIGKSLGKGIREFRSATTGLMDSIEVETDPPEEKQVKTAPGIEPPREAPVEGDQNIEAKEVQEPVAP